MDYGLRPHTRVAQQCHKLLLETPLLVMRLLVPNVISHSLSLRMADVKRSITFLPGEALAHLCTFVT